MQQKYPSFRHIPYSARVEYSLTHIVKTPVKGVPSYLNIGRFLNVQLTFKKDFNAIKILFVLLYPSFCFIGSPKNNTLFIFLTSGVINMGNS